MTPTPKETAIKMLSSEVYYWGQKGLETTQRVSLQAVYIRSILISLDSPEDLLEYWLQVNKEIYKNGK